MEQNKQVIEQKKPDWSIDELYRSAWGIVKNNKILWLFGMALGAGGSSGSYRSSFDNMDADFLQKIFQGSPKNSSELSQVLGASTSSFSDTLGSIFSTIPTYFYFLLGLEFLIMVILGIIATIVYGGWAHAALLEGIQVAIGKGNLTIRDLSEKAFGDLKSIIYIQYVPMFILIGIGLILFAILGVATAILPKDLIALPIIAMVIAGISLLIAAILLSMSIIWAIRIVVSDKKPGKVAVRMGFNIAKKKFWASSLLGFVNQIAIGIVTLVILLPVIGLAVGAGFAVNAGNATVSSIIMVLGIILIIFFIAGISIFSGITEAFKATVWSLAYNNIRGKYEQ